MLTVEQTGIQWGLQAAECSALNGERTKLFDRHVRYIRRVMINCSICEGYNQGYDGWTGAEWEKRLAFGDQI
jgi:hypothetical protein